MQRRNEQLESPGVVYRTSCENPGCGHTFDLRITAKEAGLLGGTMPCPRCRRHGGMLKRLGRLDDRLFVAKLVYKTTGAGASAPSDEEDLLSDIR